MVSSWALTAPPSLPSSSVTTCVCATRLTSSHTDSNAGLASRRSAWECVKLSIPWLRGTASAGSASATRGGMLSCSASTPSASRVSASMSRFSMIAAVTSSAMAAWTSGSSAMGATVSTYRSVSERTVLAHTDATDSGASTQASVRSTPAAVDRHADPSVGGLRPGAGPGLGSLLRLELGHPGAEPGDLLGVAHGRLRPPGAGSRCDVPRSARRPLRGITRTGD